MRSGMVSGCGAASATMLLLVAAVIIAQPNLGVLERTVGGLFGSAFGSKAAEPPEVLVDELAVETDRVRGRIRNPSAVALREVVVQVRLISHENGEDRTVSATVYDLASGAEAWFGIPLVGGPSVARAELVDVRATPGTGEAKPGPPRLSRRGGVGGMQDVERIEREMKQMEEAARQATGGR